MKAMVRFGGLFILCVVVATGGASCSGGEGFSITISMPITLATGLTFDDDFGPLSPGDQIPGIVETSIPMCDLPGSADLEQMVIDAAGELLGDLVELQSIELDTMTLEATSGDFSDVTSLALSWQPKPVDDVEQPEILLGEAESDEGFADTIELTDGDPADLLQLIEDDENNPAEGCPALGVEFAGSVPETAPVFDVVATVDVTVGIL